MQNTLKMESGDNKIRRREALKLLSAAAVGALLEPQFLLAQENAHIAGRPCRISISTVSKHSVRLRIAEHQHSGRVPDDGAVVLDASSPAGNAVPPPRLEGGLRVQLSHEPLTFHVIASDGRQ